jgi:hypothetical protein
MPVPVRYVLVALACALLTVFSLGSPASADTGQLTVYTATVTIPVPPASNYSGSAGGDGWELAMTPTAVYNVFHHQSTMQVACHLQSDASACWSPKTIVDGSSNNFATSGHPGLYLDQATGKLYVYGTRTSDSTAGVVCIDTVAAAAASNPFCGFTALSVVGEATISGSISAVSAPVVTQSRFYAFNFFSGAAVTGTKNTLMCFDLTTFAACASQPFSIGLGTGTVSVGNFPPPAVTAIGTRILVPININSVNVFGCFDAATLAVCSGAWPLTSPVAYVPSNSGAPFPLLTSAGVITGFCLPDGTDECYSLAAASVSTPAGMTTAIPANSGWNGAAFVLGARVYVAHGNLGGTSDAVDCYDYSASATCTNFPKVISGLELLYTVNPDPQRPTCIWVNADGGTSQIQNFDAYTGNACGAGPLRILSGSVIVASDLCKPASWVSLELLAPPRSSYTSGSVQFDDGNASQISGAADLPLDANGSVDLSAVNLTQSGLPQFLISLVGATDTSSSVQVRLTWVAIDDPSCLKTGTTTTGTPQATPTPTPSTEPVVAVAEQLPATGERTAGLTPAALAMLMIGLAFVYAANRRSRSGRHAVSTDHRSFDVQRVIGKVDFASMYRSGINTAKVNADKIRQLLRQR